MERLRFGTTNEGKEASIYILENGSGMHVQVSDFGALILTIMFPDRNGELKDVTLGFDELQEYYCTETCFGAYHKGKIELKSEIGKGTEIKIAF